ncbi:hypothetical protein NL676_029573 [Syzygium grande]|nr:hypothetical protein NL676_029573 [Syzygium grande]
MYHINFKNQPLKVKDGHSGTIVICIGKIYWKDHFANIVEGVQEEKLRAHLGYFGVTGNRALQPMYTLAGGQKSRAAFAKITFEKPYIVLLDEPSNLLDLDAAEALIQGLVLFQVGILMVSHDEHLIAGGRVVSQGKVAPFHGNLRDYRKVLQFSLNKEAEGREDR